MHQLSVTRVLDLLSKRKYNKAKSNSVCICSIFRKNMAIWKIMVQGIVYLLIYFTNRLVSLPIHI